MAAAAVYREPNAVLPDEIDSQTVLVELVCDGIELGAHGGNANATVEVDFQPLSFCVTAEVRTKNGPIHYKKFIKRLPGEIIPDECSYTVSKDKIIVELKKKEENSWQSQMLSSGLDQSSSEDSD